MQKKFKIRCSAIGKIMAGETGITDKQEIELSKLTEKFNSSNKLTDLQYQKYVDLKYKKENPKLPQTAKTYLEDCKRVDIYGLRKDISNKYTTKGLVMENEAIELYGMANDLPFASKNDERFSNDFMTGEPDIILPGKIVDIKCSWDCFTFPLFDTEIENKDYFYQLQGYMHLTGKKKAQLAYMLMNTPEEIAYTNLDQADYTNFDFKYRIKTFDIDYDEEVINQIKERVELCREYLDTL